MIEQNPLHELLPAIVPEEQEADALASPMVVQVRVARGPIDNDGHTCDTVIPKNDHEDDELLSDENDVTIHLSSFHADPTSSTSTHTPLLVRCNQFQQQRSNSEGQLGLLHLPFDALADNKSLQ